MNNNADNKNTEKSNEEEPIKQWSLKKFKWNRDTFLILVLIGLIIFVVFVPLESKQKESVNKSNETDKTASIVEEISANTATTSSEDEEYVAMLTNQLEGVLTRMEVVGKAGVMITLKSSSEQVIEKDISTTRQSSVETDSSGGSRTTNDMDNGESTIYQEDNSGNKSPYVVKKIHPTVEGVIVVAQGGGNATISKNITDMIQALFGIEAHKIVVVKMKTE